MALYNINKDAPNLSGREVTAEFSDGSNVAMVTKDENKERVAQDIKVDGTSAQFAPDEMPRKVAKLASVEIQEAQFSGGDGLVVGDNPQLDAALVDNGLDVKDGKATNAGVPLNTDAAFGVVNAIDAGYSNDEVKELLSKQGLSEKQVARAFSNAANISAARQAGYSDDEVRAYLAGAEPSITKTRTEPSQEVRQKVLDYINDSTYEYNDFEASRYGYGVIKKKPIVQRLQEDYSSPEELVSDLKELNPVLTTMVNDVMAFSGHAASQVELEYAQQLQRDAIDKFLVQRKIPISYDEEVGTYVHIGEDGTARPIDDSIWEDIKASSGELVGSVGGAAVGAKIGSRFGLKGTVAGAVVGGTGGAIAGDQFDYIRTAMKLNEELSADIAAARALTTAQDAIVTEAVFGAGGLIVKGGARIAVGIKDALTSANPSRALKGVKEWSGLADDEFQTIVNAYARTVPEANVNSPDTAIRAVINAKGGTEELFKAVSAENSGARNAVLRDINARAEAVLASSHKITGDNVANVLIDDLDNYTLGVKEFYANVRKSAIDNPNANQFEFDMKELAVMPVLANIKKHITDPHLAQKYLHQMERVASISEARTFTDLLDLRQLVNGFKFNSNVRNSKDFDSLNSVLAKIDEAIEGGAKEVFSDNGAWLDSYKTANAEWAKMKSVEKNVMYQALTKKGLSEHDVVKSVSRYINSIDGTYAELVAKLPKESQQKFEAATVQVLTEKYTARGVDSNAIDFPNLASDLNQMQLLTEDAVKLRHAVNEFAEVFKNDTVLAQVSGKVTTDTFKSYLTTDPVMRLKFEAASGVFNHIARLKPTKAGREAALVNYTAKMLENPMHAKNFSDFVKEAEGIIDPELATKLQSENARQLATKDNSSMLVRVSGDGNVKRILKSSVEKASSKIPMHRIISINDAKQQAEKFGIIYEDTKQLDELLQSMGYVAIQKGSDGLRMINK